jgi:hypothetical protein
MPEGISDHGPAGEDEIDRRLRELSEEAMGPALFKEASAADRAKRASQDMKKYKRQHRRKGRSGRIKAASIAVAVLAVAGGIAWLRLSHVPAGHPSAQQSPLDGTLTGGAPPTDPFASTPAENWPNGASGIVTPAGRPVGSFTAPQVMTAYQATRRLLIAANLDKQTLLGGTPTAFEDLLTKQQRADFVSALNKKGVNHGGYPLSTRKWVASFFPGSAVFIGNVIKVRGVMSAQIAHEAGGTVLAIKVNYIFAYAVERPGNPSDWMRLLDHQYGSIDFAQWDDPGGPLEAWDQTIIGNAGTQCGTTDGYIHPDYPSERTPVPTESGPALNPYSPATAVHGGGAVCGRTTGT